MTIITITRGSDMNRILCSTGALIGRANGRDYTLLKECAKRLDCGGFEFMMYADWYEKADSIAEYFSGFDKPFPTFHIEKAVGELISGGTAEQDNTAVSLFEANCRLAQRLGSGKLVLHLWGGLASDMRFAHNLEMYPLLRDIADRYGLLLTIENVVCNISDPMTHLGELLAAYPDTAFTFDTKMAEFHGQLSDIYLEKNRHIWEHTSHLHVNDYKGGVKDWSNLKTLHIGDGQIEFDAFFGFIGKTGYKGDITIESTSFDKSGVIDFDKMNESIRKVQELLKKYGFAEM